jgi:hypothetical protein
LKLYRQLAKVIDNQRETANARQLGKQPKQYTSCVNRKSQNSSTERSRSAATLRDSTQASTPLSLQLTGLKCSCKRSNKRFASCDREQNNINKLTKQGNDDSTGCNNAAITDEFEDGGRIE